ncbi:DNA primase [Streptomyces sp. NPDC093568]|uniref:DNA primase n=1 Tax=Streptomyces sp. NPDC093568 TaxID=3366041 RepID=UPI003809E71E
MNRVGLGLAVGAGYVLGRTKKAKLAFALGTLAAGKRLNLSPRAVADLVSQQLQNNPQFKEIGDQLREDLRGVGKAASGAMVERQLDAFSDRLHGRTAEVREQLSGAVPTPDLGSDDEAEDAADDERAEREPEQEESEDDRREEPARKATAKKTAAKKTAKKAAKKAPAAKKTAPKKAAAKRTGAPRSAARKTAAARRSKGGDES